MSEVPLYRETPEADDPPLATRRGGGGQGRGGYPLVDDPLYEPSAWDQITLFNPMICTGARRNPANCGTNHGN